MRIGIDHTPAIRQKAGIGRYTRELVRALAVQDPDNQYVLFCAAGRREVPEAQPPAPNFQVRLSGVSERALLILWHRLRVPVPVEWWTGPVDIFHSPDFTLPPLSHARGLVTVHDLAFLRVPECADPRLRAYLSSAVPRSLRRAWHSLADSECTRQDLAALLDVDLDKVAVVPAGVDACFRPDVPDAGKAAVRRRYHLEHPYILSVGTVEPRKNHVTLIAAYARLRRATGLSHELVIAGGSGWLNEPIYAAPEKYGVAGHVRFLGWIDDKELPALYAAADAFAFPSLYEGFGLPPLEAMACGVPVVVANNSSLPEVVGDAALLVDARDDDGLAATLERALCDGDLRSSLRARGIQRAAMYTWERAANKLLSVYHQIGEAS
ncbi:MAG: glycosyltransferase family 4 protein [Anaerolineae bacterium]|nr:glycosyltransferase family 4 protein [Anaerolineae bacterium]